MAESDEEIAKQLGMTTENWIRFRDAEKHPGFIGSVEFEIVFEVLGERVVRRMRVNYTYTPEWEYFDLRRKEIYIGWASSSMGFEILTVADPPYESEGEGEVEEDVEIDAGNDNDNEIGADNDDDHPPPPAWVKFDFVGEGMFPRSVWDRIDALIDEKCKAEDKERRRKNAKTKN